MPYVPYRTATEWQQYFAGLNNGPSDQVKIAIDTLGALENQAGTVGNTESAMFSSQDGVYSYTEADAPQLANLVGKTVIGCFISGGTLAVAAITWDDTTMLFDSNAVTFDSTIVTIVVLAQ